ncbi:XRE family transcriptional regulator [Bacteriovoracaceae bacterium]|nr:XRE family transcriptional regulator [Bacteriovoracaceae bacterium]
MKKEKLETMKIKDFADDLGINYQVLKIKQKLIASIKNHCEKNKISQRSLAKKVPGLTQDRISKIFNDQVGGMTIDKLVQILSILNIKISVSFKKAA